MWKQSLSAPCQALQCCLCVVYHWYILSSAGSSSCTIKRTGKASPCAKEAAGTRATRVNGIGQGIDLSAVIQQNDAPQDDTAEWGSCTPRDSRGIFLVAEHSLQLSKIDFNVLMRLKWTCIRTSSKFCINKMFATKKFNLQILQNFPYI